MTLNWISSRLRLLARSEQGIALPVALFATITSLGLAGAAVMSSVDVQRGTKRDNGSKGAIGAADAGANVAMQRLNRYGDSLSEDKPCLVLNSSGDLEADKAPAADPAWCAPIAGEVGGAAYSYQVSAFGGSCGGRDICIVSTGTDTEVDRRIELSLDESSLYIGLTEEEKIKKQLEIAEQKEHNQAEIEELQQELEDAENSESTGGGIAGLIGREGITASGNSDIKVGVGTNGNLTTSGNTTICGDIQVGVGKTWTHSGNAKQCSGYTSTEGTLNLPSVASFMPSDIATHNSNGRITACSNGLPAECEKDTYNGKWSSTAPFNPSNRSISLSGNTILTLGGGDYWICSLSLSGNSKFVMAKGAKVRFFFDTPEHCGNPNQISMSGNNEITATGYEPAAGQFDVPGFYLLGSTSWVSQVSLSGNSSTTDEFVIYGPDSYINVSGNATFKGIVAGRQIAWSGNGKIENDQGFVVPPEIDSPSGDGSGAEAIAETKTEKEEEQKKLDEEEDLLNQGTSGESGGRSFFAQSYVECSGGAAAAGADPNSGC
jgi:hypothetical protein